MRVFRHLKLICLALASFAGATAFAQPVPDLEGVWDTSSITPFERLPFDARAAIPESEETAYVAKIRGGVPELVDPDFDIANLSRLTRVRGELRTSVVIDPPSGLIPYTAEGERLLNAGPATVGMGAGYDNPEERSTFDRCVGGSGSPPMRPIPAPVPLQIVQTPGSIAMMIEDVYGFREVHLDASPPLNLTPNFDGWSKGRYEGGALVIETTGFRDDWLFRDLPGPSFLIGANSKVTERLTRMSPDELLYEFTVEDPRFYKQPWRGEYTFVRMIKPRLEYACHEGNRSLEHILLSGRIADERKGR